MVHPDAMRPPPIDTPATSKLLACPDCDLLHQAIELAPNAQARCLRCHAALRRAPQPQDADLTLSLALASLVLLGIAHLNPVFGIEVQGQQQSASLWQAAMTLWDEDAWFLSVLVLTTTLLFPLVELLALCTVLLYARAGRVGPGIALVLRTLHAVRPWVMVEVLMLGVLIALVKLSSLAEVLTGPGLWSFALLMLLLAATSMLFDEASVWEGDGLSWSG